MNLIKNLNVTEINTALLSLMDYIKKIENATEKEEQKIESSSSSSSSDFSELTVPLVGGSGEVINSIEQTDGKITATTQSIDRSVEQGSSNPVASGAVYTALNNKIESLDVSSVGGSGKYISAISETDGKINATATDLGNMVPVNSVTSGNMHSVTSNAVYTALQTVSNTKVPIAHHGDYMYLYKYGKVVYMSLSSDWSDLVNGFTYNLAQIPQGYRPIAYTKFRETTVSNDITLIINSDGEVDCYNYTPTFTSARNGQYYGCWITEE